MSPAPLVPKHPTPDQTRALQLATRLLRRGPAVRDVALGMLIDAGYSAWQASRIVRDLLAEMEPSDP